MRSSGSGSPDAVAGIALRSSSVIGGALPEYLAKREDSPGTALAMTEGEGSRELGFGSPSTGRTNPKETDTERIMRIFVLVRLRVREMCGLRL